MNRPKLGNPAYPVFYALNDCTWLRTGNLSQIGSAMRAYKLVGSISDIQKHLLWLVKHGYVKCYIGTNPHSGAENDTIYQVIE